jgi:hypothetical protein
MEATINGSRSGPVDMNVQEIAAKESNMGSLRVAVCIDMRCVENPPLVI